MTRLTDKQRTVLLRLSDGSHQLGADLSAPGVLGVMDRNGWIRPVSGSGTADAMWVITRRGADVLEDAE